MEASENYKTWVERYKIGVIERFFGGDNKPLLKLHQQSNPTAFFTLVGEKYGAPPEKAAQAGEDYMQNLILQGIFT